VGGAGFESVGLSPELGALVMGAVIATHRRAMELSNALWGLKEVFLIGFFLQIGMSGLPSLDTLGWAILLALLLPVKAVLFFFVLVLFRLRARTAFLAALSLATYSEFGLIVANLAVKNGLFGPDWLVMLAVAAVFFGIVPGEVARQKNPVVLPPPYPVSVAAAGLHATGRAYYASAWPSHIQDKLAEAKQSLADLLDNEQAIQAGEAALTRMYEGSQSF